MGLRKRKKVFIRRGAFIRINMVAFGKCKKIARTVNPKILSFVQL